MENVKFSALALAMSVITLQAQGACPAGQMLIKFSSGQQVCVPEPFDGTQVLPNGVGPVDPINMNN